MTEITSYLIGKLVDLLPAFIMSRLFPPKKVLPQIKIALRGERPIGIIGGAVPCIYIDFEITNLSYLSVVLDRMLIECWFGQPCFYGTLARRYAIPSRGIVNSIRYMQDLTTEQLKQIEPYKGDPGFHGSISLDLTAYFEAKGTFLVATQRITRDRL